MRVLTSGGLALLLLVSGCDPISIEPDYVEDEVMVRFENDTPFRTTFHLVDSLGLSIKYLHYYFYAVDASADMVGRVRELVHAKPYASAAGQIPRVRYEDERIVITMHFSGFGKEEAQDWFDFAEDQVFYELVNRTDGLGKWGLLKVPIGKESHFIDVLRENELVAAVQLNHNNLELR